MVANSETQRARGWNDSDVTTLRALSAAGWPLAQIASKMGRSRPCLQGKLRRLGLFACTEERISQLADAVRNGGSVDPAVVASWPIDHRIAFQRLIETKRAKVSSSPAREGQARFRAAVLANYQNVCCATGCSTLEVVEAAHIVPYSALSDHSVSNGLALRVDIHRLFDAGLIAVHPDRYTFIIATAVRDPSYRILDGAPAKLDAAAIKPSTAALSWHLHNRFQAGGI